LAAKRVKIFRNLRVFGEVEFSKQYRHKGETVALVLVRSDCDPSTSSLLASNWLLYRPIGTKKILGGTEVAGARAATNASRR
jgi:hypothetical protein